MLIKPVKRLRLIILASFFILCFVLVSYNVFRKSAAGSLLSSRPGKNLIDTVSDALGNHTYLTATDLDDNDQDPDIDTDLYADDDDNEEDEDNTTIITKDDSEGLESKKLVQDLTDNGGTNIQDKENLDYEPLPDRPDYREIFSLTTRDRKYYSIYTGGMAVYNPNLIPHPTRHDLWIFVAHRVRSTELNVISEQVICTAGFLNGGLLCTADPTVVPVEPSIPGRCEGELFYVNFLPGPRDARMFYGPEAPLIVYGSQSRYTCLGIWLQDVRMLIDDYALERSVSVKLFQQAVEIQRPPPARVFEKNFFLFWDSENKAYVHHDIFPHRVFAQLSYDGSIGPDLAPHASNMDNVCMTKYMPALSDEGDSIHQATNSLAITLCERADSGCIPDDNNTFVMTIFQQKSYRDYHGIYEPYVMLFRRSAPFAVHAISQRPLWIHGRAPLTRDTHSLLYDNDPGRPIPEGHTEMFYITSMSWKTHGQKYHGYIDDPLFLAFGIEDSRPAVIDVLAGDLLQDLGLCAH